MRSGIGSDRLGSFSGGERELRGNEKKVNSGGSVVVENKK